MPNETASFCARLKTGYQDCQSSVEDGFLLAVSGGADSVAMLQATAQLWPEHRERIVVAHVDHSLRKESTDDSAFVRRHSARLGLQCEVLTIPAGQLTGEAGQSIEEAARKARYAFLATTANKYKLQNVVTAHHMDDQAETVLHNILRGTGLRGLRGMQTIRELNDGIQLIRPMLNFRRSEIIEFLTDMNAPFKMDASNQDLCFTRNRLRQHLLPQLKNDFNESADRNLVSLAHQAQQTLDVLDALADRILSDAVLERQENICRLDRRKLCEWPAPIIRHVLSVLWIRQGWPRQKMTFGHYERLAQAITNDTSTQYSLPGAITVRAEIDVVRLTRETAD